MYVAIGYGLANSIMLEGDEGVIIIDTLESCEVAREVRAAFEEVRLTDTSMGWGLQKLHRRHKNSSITILYGQVTNKPVVGIILTHFHADHAYGTAGGFYVF